MRIYFQSAFKTPLTLYSSILYQRSLSGKHFWFWFVPPLRSGRLCTPHQEFKWYFKITENRRPVKSLRELSFAKFIADNPMVVIPAWLLALFFFSHSSILSHSHLVLLCLLEFYHLSLPALSLQKPNTEHKYLNWVRNMRDNCRNDW